MRYRALDANGDYVAGRNGQFLVNSPQCVAQAVMTRLKLWAGEWFLDSSEGVPYWTDILGYGTQNTRDFAIKDCILNTPGVTGILDYSSGVDAQRKMTVSVTIQTQYGATAPITFQGSAALPTQTIFYYDGARVYDGSQTYSGVRSLP